MLDIIELLQKPMDYFNKNNDTKAASTIKPPIIVELEKMGFLGAEVKTDDKRDRNSGSD